MSEFENTGNHPHFLYVITAQYFHSALLLHFLIFNYFCVLYPML